MQVGTVISLVIVAFPLVSCALRILSSIYSNQIYILNYALNLI